MRAARHHRYHTQRWRSAGAVLLSVVAVAIVGAAAPGLLFAANEPLVEIGRSVVVINQVEGKVGEQSAKSLKINDDIIFEEDVSTHANAKTVIEFRDGSTFELGPDAVVRINSFIYNPKESISHKTLSITSGAFRYMSGPSVRDQDTKLATSSGTLGIRGSIISGVVAPKVPVFLHVTEGDGTFTNDAGATNLTPGNSIAVPSRFTKPMRPDLMPCAVAQQALQAITAELPPSQALREKAPPSAAELARLKALNSLPASQQQVVQPTAPAGPAPPPPTTGPPVTPQLQLLTEANAVNAFNGAQAPTQQQQAFRSRVERMLPDACAVIQTVDAQTRALHAEVVATTIATTGSAIAPPATAPPPPPPPAFSPAATPPSVPPGTSPAK